MVKLARRIASPAAGRSVRLWCGAAAVGIGAGLASYTNGAAWWFAALAGLAACLGTVAAPGKG